MLNVEFQITTLTELPSQVALLTLDDPSSRANVMNQQLQAELYARLDELESGAFGGLIVMSSKPRIYIAGADIKYIADTGHFSHDQVIEFCEYGQRLYQRYSELPFPTVAAIQGACLGGGLEFAMALDARLATEDSLIGLPEVQLGLIPGWAATARVARLCSVETAMRRIGGGQNFMAPVAQQIGLVDRLVAGDQLLDAALQWTQQRAEQNDTGYRHKRTMLNHPARFLREDDRSSDASPPVLEQDSVDDLARQVLTDVLKDSALHPRAPQAVIDLIRRSALEDLATASRLEAEAMATVYTSDSGQSLVNAFLLNDRAKKSPGRPPAPEPMPEVRSVGIVGLGIMGHSIAQLSLSSGWELRLFDVSDQRRQQVAQSFQEHPQVTVVDSLQQLAGVDVVLENVFERHDIKQKVLQDLEVVVGPTTHLLTNTSVIPIESLAAGLQHPERFGGLHFFNPIAETRMAEIARHSSMLASTQWVAHQVAQKIRKLSLFVEDGPGLVVNRLLMALLNEAQHLLAEGHSIESIDQAAVQFGWRLGPFQILDVIGLSTAFDAGRQISRQLPQAVDAPPFLLPLIKAGRQGKDTGLGFYRYQDGQRIEDPELRKLIDHFIRPTGQPCDAGTMIARMNGAMVGQACEILEREQVTSPQDIDLCTLLALGFPPYRGGLLFWAQRNPLARLVETLQHHRPGYELPESLARRLRQNADFYGAPAH